MNNYMTVLRGLIVAVALASVFTIFVVTILRVIKRAGFFSERASVLVATSLSILLLVALLQFLVGLGEPSNATGPDTRVNGATRYFLLPSVALGVAATVLLSQVMLLASRTSPGEESGPFPGRPENAVAKPNPRGRPKKNSVKKQQHAPPEGKKAKPKDDGAVVSEEQN